MPNTENKDTQNVSEETLTEQQFNGCLLELNQENQGENFNCQEECNTLTEKYISSTSCKSNIWVLPLTLYTKQTLDHTETISPPHLEIDFIIESGAPLNVLNNDSRNEIKEYHKLQLKELSFVLSSANNSRLQSNGTVKPYIQMYQR